MAILRRARRARPTNYGITLAGSRNESYFKREDVDESYQRYQPGQRGGRRLSQTLTPIRSRSALRRLHVGRSRRLAIHHAPEHYFPEGVRAQGLLPGFARHGHFIRTYSAHSGDERHSREDRLGR